MKTELVETLKAMNEATDLIEEVVAGIKLEAEGTKPERLREIKQKLQPFTWLIQTRNQIEGVVGNKPVKLVMETDFGLDTQTLFEKVDQAKLNDKPRLDAVVGQLKSRPNGEALAEILVESLLPHAYGISQRIQINESLYEFTQVGLVEEMVEMVADGGLIRLDYAQTLARFLPPPLSIGNKSFREKVWVNQEFFRASESFEKSFYWQDEINGDALSINIDASFKRF